MLFHHSDYLVVIAYLRIRLPEKQPIISKILERFVFKLPLQNLHMAKKVATTKKSTTATKKRSNVARKVGGSKGKTSATRKTTKGCKAACPTGTGVVCSTTHVTGSHQGTPSKKAKIVKGGKTTKTVKKSKTVKKGKK